MTRRRLSIVAIAMALAALAACSNGETADQGPDAESSAIPSARSGSVLPSQMVGQWDVTGVGVEPGTILTLRADEALFFVKCGMFDGSWDALPGGAFLADIYGASGKCGQLEAEDWTPAWLGSATSFAVNGDQRELRGSDGQVTATLRPAAARPRVPKTAVPEFGDVPVLTDDQRADLDQMPPAVPAGLRPVEPTDLLGTWVLPGQGFDRDNWPHATFEDGGALFGSDGCNGVGGKWAAAGGALLFNGGPTTLIGCENINVLSGAVVAGLDGETLVLIDEKGQETRRLVHGPAPKPISG